MVYRQSLPCKQAKSSFQVIKTASSYRTPSQHFGRIQTITRLFDPMSFYISYNSPSVQLSLQQPYFFSSILHKHKLQELGHYVKLYKTPLEYVLIFSLFFLHSKYCQKLLISSKAFISSLLQGFQLLIKEHDNRDQRFTDFVQLIKVLENLRGQPGMPQAPSISIMMT